VCIYVCVCVCVCVCVYIYIYVCVFFQIGEIDVLDNVEC